MLITTLLLLAGGLATAARAQTTAARPPAVPPTAAPAPAVPADAQPGEPQVRRIVIEDERARISELRVRGVTRRIVIDPKTGIRRSYEVIPNDPSRDPSPAVDSNRGAGGQRVWNVLDF